MPATIDAAVEKAAALAEIGFLNVCVVNKSYQVAKAIPESAVPKAWNDSEGTMINENQSLADIKDKKSTFAFFNIKFKVVSSDTNFAVGSHEKEIVVCKEYKNFWIVAHGRKGSLLEKSDKKKGDSGKVFASAPVAYSKACTTAFDELDEDED